MVDDKFSYWGYVIEKLNWREDSALIELSYPEITMKPRGFQCSLRCIMSFEYCSLHPWNCVKACAWVRRRLDLSCVICWFISVVILSTGCHSGIGCCSDYFLLLLLEIMEVEGWIGVHRWTRETDNRLTTFCTNIWIVTIPIEQTWSYSLVNDYDSLWLIIG